MIPTITCIENACVAGVVWRPDLMAAFLAWWMPLNLLSWLGFMAFVHWKVGGEWEDSVLKLSWFLSMTLFFWPWIISKLVSTVILVWIDNRHRKKRMSNQEAYFRNKHFTEDF